MFFVSEFLQGIGEPVGAVSRAHAGPVTGPLSEGGSAGGDQAGQDRGWLALADGDYARNEPPVFGHVDDFAMPDPREHLTCMVPEVPQPNRVGIRSRHAVQCITNLWQQIVEACLTSTALEVLRSPE